MPQARTLPDGSQWEWVVEWARTSEASLAAYDVSEYDTAVYDGAGGELQWNDATGFTKVVTTRRGKDAFLKSFRTGSGSLELTNENGRWSSDGAGFSPGDFVRLSVRVTPVNSTPPSDVPIPDLTTWDDSTGSEWTSHGSLLLHLDGNPAVTYRVFYGRVDINTSQVRRGIDTLKVRIVGLFADWAVIDLDAVPAEGAGDTAAQRFERLFDAAGFDWDSTTEYGNSTNTMQATTLAQVMLGELQLTAASEGGDVFELGDGTFAVGYQDWLTTAPHTTTIQHVLGFDGTIGIIEGQPSATLQVIVNNATFSVVGGSQQNSIDASSIARFGNRTTRRLDLIAVGDGAALFLANRAVVNLAAVRTRLRQVTVDATDFASADFCGSVKFGDLILVEVHSINGWARAFLAHCIGISHTTSADSARWRTTITLDDAFVPNVDGDFDFEEFNSGFALGGQP